MIDPTIVWHSILDRARLTPSPHNTQPWKVRIVDSETADLFLDHRRALPKEDTTGCFVDCGMGMFIESIELLARNRGFSVEIDNLISEPWIESVDPLERFAQLRLVPKAVSGAVFDDEIFTDRQTSRLATIPNSVTDDLLAELTDIANRHGQVISLVRDSPTIQQVMSLNLQAVVADLNSADYHDEIVHWFRFTEKSAARFRDGLSSACMVIPPHEFYLLARFPWIAKIPIFGGVFRHFYAWRLRPVHELCYLAGSFWNRRSAVKAGRCLMQLWLAMAPHEVYIHPFGNLVTNATASAGLARLFKRDDIWIVFRIGKTKQPSRSHRLSLSEILI